MILGTNIGDTQGDTWSLDFSSNDATEFDLTGLTLPTTHESNMFRIHLTLLRTPSCAFSVKTAKMFRKMFTYVCMYVCMYVRMYVCMYVCM